VSLGAEQIEATQQAIIFNTLIDEAQQLQSLGVSEDIIKTKLSVFHPIKLQQEVQNPPKEVKSKWKQVSEDYINSKVDSVSSDEIRDRKYFYSTVAPSLFKHIIKDSNPDVSKISYQDLLECKNIIMKLPKRNIQKYRDMTITSIITTIGTISSDDIISNKTVNKYIKWLRAIFHFSLVMGYINVNLASSITILKTAHTRHQREPLSNDEFHSILSVVSDNKGYLLRVLRLTGMRLSELYKCKITKIDDVLCFSLLDVNIKLKTNSSYRLIPIHSSLLDEIDNYSNCLQSVKSETLARNTTDIIKSNNFKDKHKKSLYSLRHSITTELIQRKADSNIVSELLGHSHSSMTLSRYSKGYSVAQLKEVIELQEAV
jgi:integrase